MNHADGHQISEFFRDTEATREPAMPVMRMGTDLAGHIERSFNGPFDTRCARYRCNVLQEGQTVRIIVNAQSFNSAPALKDHTGPVYDIFSGIIVLELDAQGELVVQFNDNGVNRGETIPGEVRADVEAMARVIARRVPPLHPVASTMLQKGMGLNDLPEGVVRNHGINVMQATAAEVELLRGRVERMLAGAVKPE